MRVAIACIALAACVCATPLDDYVNKPDPNYAWVELPVRPVFHRGAFLSFVLIGGSICLQEYQFKGPGYTGHVLNMTSQQWLTSADSDRSIWWHYLAVIVPDEIEFHTQVGSKKLFEFSKLFFSNQHPRLQYRRSCGSRGTATTTRRRTARARTRSSRPRSPSATRLLPRPSSR